MVARREATTGVRGIAVARGEPHALHLIEVPTPGLGPDDVMVRTRRVGVCGTDREIIEGMIGRPPEGERFLVLGHEVLGVVEAVGEAVTGYRPGDLVSATVRRPDGCPACRSGQPDFCLWRRYDERGIANRHGYMAERWVEAAEHLVPVPAELEPIGVLIEPLSVVEKAYRQAIEIQRRIVSWKPTSALVFGAGPIGLLQTMLLRERGLDVWTVARTPAPTEGSRVVDACGATYVSSRERDILALERELPNLDIVIEASGASVAVNQAMDIVGTNGVLVLLSLTGGDDEMPAAVGRINREFVAGNKVMVGSVNAHRDDFVSGVERLRAFERLWPGLAESLITRRLTDLSEALDLGNISGGIKTVIELG